MSLTTPTRAKKEGCNQDITPEKGPEERPKPPAAKRQKQKKTIDKPKDQVAFACTHKGANFFTEAKAAGSQRHDIMQVMKEKATGGEPGSARAAGRLYIETLNQLHVTISSTKFCEMWVKMQHPDFDWDHGVVVVHLTEAKTEPSVKDETSIKRKKDQHANGVKMERNADQQTPAKKSKGGIVKAETPVKLGTHAQPQPQRTPAASSAAVPPTLVKPEGPTAIEATSTNATSTTLVVVGATSTNSSTLMAVSQPSDVQIRFAIAAERAVLTIALSDGTILLVDSAHMKGASTAVAAAEDGTNVWLHSKPEHALALVMHVHDLTASCVGDLPGALLLAYQLGFGERTVSSLLTAILPHLDDVHVSRQMKDNGMRRVLRKAVAYSKCTLSSDLERWWSQQS
jgi:hypothetical protein